MKEVAGKSQEGKERNEPTADEESQRRGSPRQREGQSEGQTMTHLRDTHRVYEENQENHGFIHSRHANDTDWDALPTRI